MIPIALILAAVRNNTTGRSGITYVRIA